MGIGPQRKMVFSLAQKVGQTVLLRAGGKHQRKKHENTITQIQDRKTSDEFILQAGRTHTTQSET